MSPSASATLQDFVVVLDDALPRDYSDRVLGEYQPSELWRPGEIQEKVSGEGVRNCHIIDISHPDAVDDKPERHQLLVEMTTLAQGWFAAYQDAVGVTIGVSGRTGIVLARYREGGFYRSHHDAHGEEVRALTAIAVPYSDFSGGALSFFHGEHVVDLMPGQACLFPSTFQYPHAVEPVVHGTRYSLITWLR